MSSLHDDPIVQDFLLEGGEILEQLGAQLIDLENQPDNKNLLNAVFRGFHTIKGGAGFLGFESIVHVSHKCEDIFDLLRKGERQVNSSIMDVVLRVLDSLNGMFNDLRSGESARNAPEDLIQDLILVVEGKDLVKSPEQEPEISPENNSSCNELSIENSVVEDIPPPNVSQSNISTTMGGSDLITDDEFENLLDQLQSKKQAVTATPAISQAEKIVNPSPLADDGQTDQLVTGQVEVNIPAESSVAHKVIDLKPSPESEKVAKVPTTQPAASAQNETTVRVETVVLDRIMNLVGELVLIRNRISTLESALGNEDISKTASLLDVITSDLQTMVMKTRMQPIRKVFGRFPRVVRDLARSLKKEVNLELHGEETDLDKNLVEALADPLVHLVRNAVDHGIEMPDVREAAGKPRTGTVKLTAEQEGDHILLKISDDGGGMDPQVLRRKAFEKGLMDEESAQRLDEHACYELIFAPGFSTKTEISDVSGRGVGMDVVKTKINQLNGAIEISSALGRGTTISIKLPLTLAIIPTLMVMLGDQIFALPLVNVNEILDFDSKRTNIVDGQELIIVRGRPLPLYYLNEWLVRGFCGSRDRGGHVVVVTIGTKRVAFLIDELIGQVEVVIKPLGAFLYGTKGIAGATVTGDGRIALILDLPELLASYARRY